MMEIMFNRTRIEGQRFKSKSYHKTQSLRKNSNTRLTLTCFSEGYILENVEGKLQIGVEIYESFITHLNNVDDTYQSQIWVLGLLECNSNEIILRVIAIVIKGSVITIYLQY
ncbi:hypothetical protein TTHERM_01516340 (macronuclear) [Tetrahymena thermophila SB210]|uniref:Uncharacterized protein n=1 Tax=Tetrahymena thermophila (strain SB210) TaxID=312017 RepID=Q24FT2_TETTS|nr:hypothetical protein TTHERM_01516340 [Tetrahymena thermophila SB210]EAS06638.2 hypothetical protein TTHERM_01516340 [Tetrahymena thermophila SB210]|eukprot:XP_001026883.2 hypothetical protein TTHERM_01516340 [Tetrahymena thermophila SB210]